MQKTVYTFLVSIFLSGVAFAGHIPPDSVGMRIIGGKAFVMHRVDKGESLYSLSKRYGASVSSIKEINDLKDNSLRIGQMLQIPYKKGNKSLSLKDFVEGTDKNEDSEKVQNTRTQSESKVKSQSNIAKTGGKKHKVEKGETLYSISRKYNVTVDEIMEWNHLESPALNIGQILIISKESSNLTEIEKQPDPVKKEKIEPVEVKKERTLIDPNRKTINYTVKAGETLYGVARENSMSLKEIRELNKLIDTDIREGQTLKVWASKANDVVKKDPVEHKNEGVVAQENVVEDNGGNVSEVRKNKQEAISKQENIEPQPSDTLVQKITELEKGSKIDPAFYIPPMAEKVKRESGDGKRSFWAVTEKGTAGNLEGEAELQKKFYAAHATLPKGTIVKVEVPRLKQSITVEIVDHLSSEDDNLIRLSTKARLYLMHESPDEEVFVRYSVPIKQ